MFFGACSGSTSGAMKCVRISILFKVMINEFKRIVHPNAVIPVRMAGKVVPTSVQSAILAYTVIYIFMVIIGLVVNMLFKPRTWCSFCPMGTMTQMICKIKAKEKL